MGIENIRSIKQKADKTPKYKLVNGVKKYQIPKVSAKKKAENNGSLYKEDLELENWFKMKMRLPKICDNCGTRLSSLGEKEWRGSHHHLLDKALFPSVKTHELNHIILGFYCCHSQWHTSIENAKKMLIWNYAKRKVNMFIDEVVENHKILEHFKN
jgi:hypothetical protein